MRLRRRPRSLTQRTGAEREHWTATALDVAGVEVAEVEVEPRPAPLPEPGPAPFLVVDAGAAGRIVDWIALAWGREPTSPPR